MDKDGKISTTGLNAHLRAKHGNRVDVGATLLIRDIEKFKNLIPRALFSQTGVVVTPRRARLYPDHVEQKYLIAKCIGFFGFMAYPDLPHEECMPNPRVRPAALCSVLHSLGTLLFRKQVWYLFPRYMY